MVKKQSSPELSSKAAVLMSLSDDELRSLAAGEKGADAARVLFEDIRSIAASVVSQDEVKGP